MSEKLTSIEVHKATFIKELREIKDTDWTLSDVYHVIERAEDEGMDLFSEVIREHIGEKYIKDDWTMNQFWLNRLDDGKRGLDFDLVVMTEVLSNGVTFAKPMFANVYGNLENMDSEDLIEELVALLENE